MLFEYQFSFGNRPLYPQDFPDYVNDRTSLLQILEYNNNHHGVIDNEFIKWALQNNITYEAILWFVKGFSEQTDPELLQLIDAKFCPYTIYCDESSNCVKFRFKDETGKFNIDWRNDFVLGGVVFKGNIPPFDIDELFSSLKLQKTVKDAKLKNIAKYDGRDVNRLLDILKSEKVKLVLSTLFNSDTYLHWATQSLLYYALADIVDSMVDIPYMLDTIKNILYKYVLLDLDYFLRLLVNYNYPSIKQENVRYFCEEFISWIDSLTPVSCEDEFYLELLRQGAKSSKKAEELIFITGNTDKFLIENFVPLYSLRLDIFSSSNIHFDKCGIVEENIEEYANIFCDIKKPYYDFLDSTENKWIQLSDFVSGIIASLLAFVNDNNIEMIDTIVQSFNETQKENIKLLMALIQKSANQNRYFDQMTCNFEQVRRLRNLILKINA